MKVRLNNGRRARIEMLPLIDIVFLLLVFFIYAMLSMAVHRGLPVVLPSSSTAGVDTKSLLAVTVKSDGSIFVDREPVDGGDLSAFLKERVAPGTDPGVMVFADRTLPYHTLFRVLDQIRISGLSRISLQAEADR